MSSVTIPLYHYGLLKGYLSGQNAPSEVLAAVEALYIAAVQGPLRSDAIDAIQAVREAAEKLVGLVKVGSTVEISRAMTEISVSQPNSEEIELPPLTKWALEKAADRAEPTEASSQPPTDEVKIAAFLEARAAKQCPPAHASKDNHEVVVGPSEPKKRKEWSPEARAAAGERMRARQAAGLMKARKKAATEAFGPESGEPVSPSFAEADLRITVPLKRRNTRLTEDDWADIKSRIDEGDSLKAIAGD